MSKYDTIADELYGSTAPAPTSLGSAPVAGNRYDAAAEELFGAPRREAQLRQNLDFAVRQDAVRFTEARQYAQRFGIPEEVAYRNIVDWRTRAKTEDAYNALSGNAAAAFAPRPLASAFRQSPTLARLAHDDVGVLSELEKVFVHPLRDLSTALPRVNQAFLGVAQLATLALAQVQADIQATLEADNREIRDGQIHPNSILARAAANLGRLRAGQGAVAQAWGSPQPRNPSIIQRGVRAGMESLGTQAPGLIASIMTRNPAYALGMAGGVTGGLSAGEAIDKGLDPGQALAYAAVDSGIEILTEKIPVSKLIGDITAGTGLFRTLAGQLAREVPGEQAATILQDLNAWANLHPEKTFADYIAERPDAAAVTFVATAVGTGVQTTAAHGAAKLARSIASNDRDAREGEALGTRMQDALNAAANSALLQRDPDQFRQLLHQMADSADETARDVFVDAEVLAALPPEVLQQLPPNVLQQIDDGAPAGGVVSIPVADALTVAPGTPLEAVLVENARVMREDGSLSMSPAEAKVAGEQAQEFMQAELDKVMQQAADQDALQAEIDGIRSTMLEQLTATRRYRPAVNEGLATWITSFYATMAARTGMTPTEMFGKYRLRIAGEPSQDSDALQSIEQTDTPEFKAWFGDSKVVDAEGKPLVMYHGTDSKAADSVLRPGTWFSAHPKEASAYANVSSLIAREKSASRYLRGSGAEYAGETVPYAGIWEDIPGKEVGEVYASDGGVAEYLGEGRWRLLDDVVVDYQSWDDNNRDDIRVMLGDARARNDEIAAEYQAAVVRRYGGDEGETGRVYPAYLSIRNPIYLPPLEANRIANRVGMADADIEATIARYKAEGYDGIATVSDEATVFPQVAEDLGGVPLQFMPFDSTQIKSAIGNRGTFDPNDPNILNQEARDTSAHVMGVERGERATVKTVALSDAEKAAIVAAAAELKSTPKAVEAAVLAVKRAHPVSKGWAPVEFLGLEKAKENEKKREFKWKKVPYTFEKGKDGNALQPGTREYNGRVRALARRMTDEVLAVYRRANEPNPENNAAIERSKRAARVILNQTGWYKEMRARLRQEFGGLGDLFADLLGATSPNTPVRGNWNFALDVLRRATRGDFDAMMPQWLDVQARVEQAETEFRGWFDEQQDAGLSKKAIKNTPEYKARREAVAAVRAEMDALVPAQESGAKYGFNGKNVIKALTDLWRVVQVADPDIGRGGQAPKAQNFAGNLIGFARRATIDVWAARMLQRLSGGKRSASMTETGVSGELLPGGRTTLQFGLGQDVFAAAVAMIRSDIELSQDPKMAEINDDDLQALVWFIEKEIWAKHNWTSAAGEGGSFEFEANLAGSASRDRIVALRKIIDSSKSTPDEKLAAQAELIGLERTLDRFTGGLSIQRSADLQGVPFIPTDYDMAQLANRLRTAALEADDGTTVMGLKLASTEGRYGDPERSIDLEAVVREGFDPAPLWRQMLIEARDAAQDSTFISRGLREEERRDLARHRPGVEVYFRESRSGQALEELLAAIQAIPGIDGYTVTVDARPTPEARAGAMPPAVGVRLQYIPEFDARYGDAEEMLALTDDELRARMSEKGFAMAQLANTIMERVPGVSYAARQWYDTEVRFNHEYDDTIDGLAGRVAAGGTAAPGAPTWQGRPLREGLAAAAKQTRISNPAAGSDASAPGQPQFDAAAAEAERSGGARPDVAQTVLTRPPVVDGRIKLQHFSQREGLTELNPDRFGEGAANRNERNAKGGKYWVNRSYYGIATGEPGGYRKEEGLLGDVAYETEIDAAALYDVAADPIGVRAAAVEAARDAGYNGDDLTRAWEKAIKDAGYAGYWVSSPSLGLVAVAFNPLPVQRQAGVDNARSTEPGGLQQPGSVRGSDGLVAEPRRPYQGDRRGVDPVGLPTLVELPTGRVEFHAFGPAQRVAEAYARSRGIDYNPPKVYAKIDPKRGARIAQAYDEMPHAPQDPEVKAAYAAMVEETIAQYQAIMDSGLTVEFIRDGDPYPSVREMHLDVVENNHMWVFSTRDGFGTDTNFDPSDNPLLAETEFEISGEVALVNDLFRVVHDYFGHVADGNGFRAEGEEHAWRVHAAMYSPLARRAATSETRGQNSWLNFGPYGKSNRTAKTADTHFADQKTGLMPEWTSEEGLADEDVVGRKPDVLSQEARGTFDPATLELVLNPNADLSTFFHETGHFFLEVMADLAVQPNAPPQIAQDMQKLMAWFGVRDAAEWRGMTLDQQRPYHERFAQSIEQYVLEGRAPSKELAPMMRRFSAWVTSVYRSLKAFLLRYPDSGMALNDDIRAVMDRMLATDEQIAEAEEVAGMLPDDAGTGEALERLRARSMADLRWTVRWRDKIIREITKTADSVRKQITEEVTAEVDALPVVQAKKALAELGKTTLVSDVAIRDWQKLRDAAKAEARERAKAQLILDNPDVTGIKKGQMLARNKRALDNAAEAAALQWEQAHPRPARDTVGTDQDVANVADAFGYPGVGEMKAAIAEWDASGGRDAAIEGRVETRMLEEHGDLINPKAIREAANEAVHNEARSRSLATELKAQAEMMNPREDTGRVNSKGRKITVNALVQAAKQFGASIADRTQLRDLRRVAWKHTQAERRAGKLWLEKTTKGLTDEAVKAKQDQVLQNAAAKAALDAAAEGKKILAFWRDRVLKGNNEKVVEKGRDPDIVNAARAVLGAYGLETPTSKAAADYMALVQRHDPELYTTIQPTVEAALANAQPLEGLTFAELRALDETIQQLWFLARESRRMEVDGDSIDIDDAAGELNARMVEIGIPVEVPGESGALTPMQRMARRIEYFGAALARVEQWADSLDKAFGGPFRRLILQPVKDAADKYRSERVVYRRKFAALVDQIAPLMPAERIEAPELGYTFGKGHNGIGMSELLHALLHTGNESNKRKLLLGRGWATETDDVFDTTRWDAFLARLHATGVLRKEHWDFVQGVWDLLEETKPAAQETHRRVFGRYFDEITAAPVETPFGTYRGGYVPAQADPELVQDAELRALTETENEGMTYAFPSTNRGFTKGRVEYNRPLKLDLRTLPQHIDKVLLFTHMEPAVRSAMRLLKRPAVSQPLGRISPAAIGGILRPWLMRAARQSVESPIAGDAGLTRAFSVLRARAGMALMFANVSNTLQQGSGLLTAGIKVKGPHMKRAMAQGLRNPNAMRDAVWALSPYMRDRGTNEVAVLSDSMEKILIGAGRYERMQAWSREHAYFMQTAFDNVLSPIVWTAAYNQGMEEFGGDERQAIRFADSTVRTTQGSTLPEDVSRLETGSPFVRMFTQFIGYFNMLANTQAGALKQLAREVGLKNGAGRALTIVMLGTLAPVWVAELIAQAFRGGPDDEDDDGYLDDWMAAVFGFGTIKGIFAQVPVVGQIGNALVARANDNPVDDRVSLSPAISLLEAAVGVPEDVYKGITGEGNAQRTVRDVASLVSLATGLPANAVARPVGYAAGVAQGRIDPTGPVDVARGLVTGTASPASRDR